MIRFSAVVVGISCIACVKVKSANVSTSDMSARLEAKALGNGRTETSAILHNGGVDSLEYIELSGTDTLTVNERALSKSVLFNVVSYDAIFLASDTPGTEYVWNLQRTSGSAPRSACTLPTGFEILVPNTNVPTFSRATQDISVQYAGLDSGNTLRYELNGLCIDKTDSTVVTDNGSFTIPRSMLHASDPTSSCEVTLKIQRVRSGSIDAAFGRGGKIECMQERTRAFTTSP